MSIIYQWKVKQLFKKKKNSEHLTPEQNLQ